MYTFLLIENRNETNIIVDDKDLQDFFSSAFYEKRLVETKLILTY
jgi:hypothetical protein